MRLFKIMLLVCCLAPTVVATVVGATTLQAMVETAPSQHGYDRYVVLESGVVYHGGLLVGATWDDDRYEFLAEPGLDIMIEGNGAILDLQGQEICVSFCNNRLDLQDCVILDGGVRFRGADSADTDRTPQGSVRFCTFYRPRDYAVRLAGAGTGVLIERNIVVDPVDTGLDYIVWTGVAGPHLPTGIAFGISVQTGIYGVPDIRDNWSWFSDPILNEDPLHHYCFL